VAEPRSTAGSVALVASNRETAGALGIAARHKIPAVVIENPGDGPGLRATLEAHAITVVALAGYLKRVPPAVTAAFRGRMVNVHPALLPAFGGPGMYGPRVHAAVLEAGVRLTGVTVHFVDEVYDHGSIIAQWPVPVSAVDSPASLAARVLEVEHHLYPAVVEAVAAGRVWLDETNGVRGEAVAVRSNAAFVLSDTETPWNRRL
jgi:folate-dependent phosphoribosylglycinamide formyltransferase PurN